MALSVQSYTLLHIRPSAYVIGFILFSTLCSYNAYWLLSKFSFSAGFSPGSFFKKNASYFIIAVFSGLAALVFASQTKIDIFSILVPVVLTIVYSIPLWPLRHIGFTRRIGFLKSTILAFTWAYVTVLLPVAGAGISFTGAAFFLFIARFFFMMILSLIFDMRDASVDLNRKFHSLATDLSKPAMEIFMKVIFVLYLFCGLMVRYFFRDYGQMIMFMVVGLLLWFVYKKSKTTQTYFFYYFVVDGMMLFCSLATILAAI